MSELAAERRVGAPIKDTLALLAGHLAWTVQLIAAYGFLEAACRFGHPGFQLLGIGSSTLIVLAMTLIPAAVTLYAGLYAYRDWHQMGRERPTRPGREWERRRFVLLNAIWQNALFILLILMTGLPALLLPHCRYAGS